MEMMHLRMVTPPGLTDRTAELLEADPYAFNIAVHRGVVRGDPADDLLTCDVLTGAANDLLRSLRALEIDRHGSLTADPAGMTLSDRAADAETRLLGPLSRAPVWEQVYARIRADGTYTASFYLFLVAAGLIGAVGILTNSQILIVGAMVVGPEHGAIVSVALGIDRGNRTRIRQGLTALAGGFALAILATFAFALLVRGLGIQPAAYERGLRPVSHLVGTPDFYSLTVALLAGIVGIVSLAHAKASTLLGVFISVTTIPAAAAIGVACAFTSWGEARGGLYQLLLNLVVLIVTGVLTLRCERAIWRRLARGGRLRAS